MLAWLLVVDLLLLGLALGLAAGISPGPLLALVITSSLERGFGAGLMVAVAPLLTDAPIILLAVLVLKDMPEPFLAGLGVIGGCFVVYLGLRTFRSDKPSIGAKTAGGDLGDLGRGALVNFFNPQPWLLWPTVQGPLLVQGWRQSPLVGLGFVTSFYLAIVGSKVAIAALVARGRHNLDQRWYRRLLQSCGVLLVVLGGWLVVQSVSKVL